MSINHDAPSAYSFDKYRPTKRMYQGQVIENDDPKTLGRVKVEIPGMTKGLEKDSIPWYHVMQQPGLGASCYTWQTFAIPQVNTNVVVMFPTEDLYSGIVIGSVINRVTYPDDKLNLAADYIHPKSSENHYTTNWDTIDDTAPNQKMFSPDFSEDYPHSWGWVSNALSWFRENMMKRTIEFVHNSMSKIKMYWNGDTVIHITGNMKIVIEKDLLLEVRGRQDIIGFNSRYTHIIGNDELSVEHLLFQSGKQGVKIKGEHVSIN